LSTAQIVGIVVGCVVCVALLLALVAFLVYWRHPQSHPWTQEDEEVIKSLRLGRYELGAAIEGHWRIQQGGLAWGPGDMAR